ncbi:MAG TPA: arginine--tRNA ligase [Hyphomicrobiaceae bacterium]|nr:arginine--tRNA ligase [Hyphomicrobiaceae bacterium]
MNIFNVTGEKIRSALEALKNEGKLPADLDLAGIDVQEPRDSQHGDLASNAGMVLAKRAGMKPRDIAGLLAARLVEDPIIATAEVAGPGFLNLRIAEATWHALLGTILEQGEAFGRSDFGRDQKVHIEYVSANPTGPMHIGHCRGAVFGDTLANVLAQAGYEVVREYYINDAGAQVDKLGQTAFLRYREALGQDIGEIPEGLYPGDYLKPVGQALVDKYAETLLEMDEAEWLPVARGTAIEMLMAEIRGDLAALSVVHDVFFSERSLSADGNDQIAAAIELLRSKNLIFEGRLPRPLGHDEDDWEDREQTLFRSTAFGDDMDRALLKSDGSYTYFAGDVAYHYNKLNRGFDIYFNVLGADHVGYIPRLKAAVSALSDGRANFQTPVTQLVKVMRDGQPVRMSKRAGTFVALRDVVDEVGRDPVRFMMMMRKHDSAVDFDLAKVVEQSKDNPVFYVKYAHARAASVFRTVRESIPDLFEDSQKLRTANFGRLEDDGERALLRELAKFPRIIEGAAREQEPHRVPFYLYDLASTFHQQWSRGNDSPQLRFSQTDDVELTMARLAMVAAVKQVICTGLSVLGVHAPEEMR